MTDELKRIWKEAITVRSGCCPNIYLDRLSNTTENLSHG
jgi:hypothetical protein